MTRAERQRARRQAARDAIIARLKPCVVCGGKIAFGKPGVNMRSKTCSRQCAYTRANRHRGWCRQCKRDFPLPKTSRKVWCSAACRLAAFHARHPSWYRDRYVPAPPVEPLPMPYVGHPLFEQARRAANLYTDYASDFGQNDRIGEAVVALLEGRDPKEAVSRWRRREAAHERRGVRLSDIDSIGLDESGNVIFGAYEEVA